MKVATLALFVVTALTGRVEAAKYTIDEGHTHIGFKIKHLGISSVDGRFRKFSGNLDYDEKTGKLNFEKFNVDVNSIDTNEPDRDKHLKSKDFFNIEKFPQLSFEINNVQYDGKVPSKISGKLTVHGITKDVTLNVTDWGGTAEDPWGNHRLAFEASGKIDRRDFGLTWNQPLKKAAGLLVGNEVKINISIEAMKSE